MALYQIPLWARFTVVGKNSPLILKKVKPFVIKDGSLIVSDARGVEKKLNEFGLLVYYDDESQLKDEFIRRHLISAEETKCFVEANNPNEAIEKFFANWEEAKIGGESPESKILRINKEKNILELSPCDLLQQNNKEEFTCGEPLENGSGVFGMCVLEGYDPPEDCPIDSFRGLLYEKEQEGNISIEILPGGYPFVSLSSVSNRREKK